MHTQVTLRDTNIYSYPSYSGKKLGVVNKGTVVSIVNNMLEPPTWVTVVLSIDGNDLTGYCLSESLVSV